MSAERVVIGDCTLYRGDARAVLPTLLVQSIDAVCTDPPYHLTATPEGTTGFMGQHWDGGAIAHDPTFWAEVLRVLKPGAHLVAFGGTRTHHRLMCALEGAGFELRDCLMWVYASGFPKSVNVSKMLDKAAGATREIVGPSPFAARRPNPRLPGSSIFNDDGYVEPAGGIPLTAPATAAARQWDGYGTSLKPAWEPIILARKPLEGTVVENVLTWGTGALNIDACRIALAGEESLAGGGVGSSAPGWDRPWKHDPETRTAHLNKLAANVAKAETLGRWPANVVHDGSAEVLALFEAQGGDRKAGGSKDCQGQPHGYMGARYSTRNQTYDSYNDTGSAARFFFCAKASPSERGVDNTHPTVKPVALLRWLLTLICPPGGVVLDPFAGSGSTGVATKEEGQRCLLIEREAEYFAIACQRVTEAYRQLALFAP